MQALRAGFFGEQTFIKGLEILQRQRNSRLIVAPRSTRDLAERFKMRGGLRAGPSAPAGKLAAGRSAVNGGGIIRFKPIDRKKIGVCQIDGANRGRDAKHNGQGSRNDEFESDHFVGHR